MSDSISPVSQPVLRPELDRAILQTFELEQFYNVQEQRMITPIRYRDDFPRLTAEEAPLIFPAAPVVAYASPTQTTDAVQPAAPAEAGQPIAAQALRELYEPVGDLAGQRSTVPSSDALIGSDPAASDPPASFPYGADAVSLIKVMDAILADGAFVPLTFQYRQAGDLVPTTDVAQTAAVAAQRVAAVYKAF